MHYVLYCVIVCLYYILLRYISMTSEKLYARVTSRSGGMPRAPSRPRNGVESTPFGCADTCLLPSRERDAPGANRHLVPTCNPRTTWLSKAFFEALSLSFSWRSLQFSCLARPSGLPPKRRHAGCPHNLNRFKRRRFQGPRAALVEGLTEEDVLLPIYIYIYVCVYAYVYVYLCIVLRIQYFLHRLYICIHEKV